MEPPKWEDCHGKVVPSPWVGTAAQPLHSGRQPAGWVDPLPAPALTHCYLPRVLGTAYGARVRIEAVLAQASRKEGS